MEKRKKYRLINYVIGIVILVVSFAILCGSNQRQTEDIVVLFTNDVASELDGEIGYAGVKGFKDELLSEYRYVSLVDAGDFFDGDVSRVSKGKYILEHEGGPTQKK